MAARTNWVILKIAIEERLMYRGDFIFSTFVRFLPIVTQICLWGAIYGAASQNRQILGYSYRDMVAYYLLTMLGRAFSSMPGLSRDIAQQIRDGSLKRYLTQPIDLLSFFFWSRVAHKLVYYVMAAVPFGVVFWLCGNFFEHRPTGLEWLGLVLGLTLSFLIGFLLEALVGLVGFWLLDIGSLSFIFMMLSYFLSGHMLPLDWLPGGLGKMVSYLPFQYLAYFPAAVLLGKFSPSELIVHLLVATAWSLFLWYLCRVTFRCGLRQYGAYGG